MKKINDIDDYIASSPKEVRSKLKEIRKAIKSAAPKAIEKISYGMPYYGYYGRLAYFAYAKTHIGLYLPPPIIDEYKRELKDYSTAKATIRFPLNKKLPISLIKRLVIARKKRNESKKIS